MTTDLLDRPDRTTEEARLAAVAARDATADGSFVYSVRSTGVYCRPSCPSRAAKRDNMAFHTTCADAERAGFRPCRRCRPNEPSQAARHAEAVAAACRLIETAEALPSLEALACAAGLSPFHFHRVFKKVTGVTPKAYASQRRAARAAGELRAAETVTAAIYDAGFNASSRFYETATTRLGMTPTAFRAGGRGMRIMFAIGECSLGAILVAATDKGVCAIAMGDAPDILARDLQDQFPEADIVGGDADFEEMVARVVGFVEAPGKRLDIPAAHQRYPRFSSGCGKRCRTFRSAARRVTRRSRRRSARQMHIARWPRPAAPTGSRSPSPATASCGPTARCRATGGASRASRR